MSRALKNSVPLVSVIIPTFNRAGLIGQAIESVLGQTLHDFEIVVVDDGSTDDTESVVKAYGDGDRVRYFRTENGRAGRARNIGASHARGKYLTCLDSDDLLYPYSLELGSTILNQFADVALVCAEMTGFDDHGFHDVYHLKTYHRSAYSQPSMTYDRLYESSLSLAEAGLPAPATAAGGSRRIYFGNVFDTYLLNIVLCQNSVMVRRPVLEAIGGRSERLRFWEDFELLLRICRQHRICFVDVPTYKLRYHEGQLSMTALATGKYVLMRKQQELLRVVKRHAFADRTYYRGHQDQIDAQLARLHRAAAVPMLLIDTPAARRLNYPRRARAYLRRSVQYGSRTWHLRALSYLPGPICRFGVTVAEKLRQARRHIVRRLGFAH